jgi:formylglycine-generating enzyme required for sulfatase activity
MLVLLASLLVTGCRAVAPTDSPVPATPSQVVQGSTPTPPPPSATPILPTATVTQDPAWQPIETASAPSAIWIRTFEGSGYGAFFDIALTEDRNVVAVGATNHLHVPPYSGDALLMKLTLDGDLLWERTWGGDGYEQAWSVAPAGDRGCYIFGETDSYGAGGRDFFLLKTMEDGSEDWFKTYGDSGREWPFGMLQLSNGELLVYGLAESETGGDRNQYALRLAPDGAVIWEYMVDCPGEELVIDALETAEGDLVLAVVVEEDAQLVKLDADGNVLWTNRFELAGWQYASQIAQLDDGGFLLTGFSMSTGSRRQADVWLARCTPAGELEWDKSFGDAAHDDYGTSLIRLKDGTYLVGGIGNGMLLSQVDQDGNVLWRRALMGQAVCGADGLVELETGGYLVAGFIQIINGRSYDAILLRTHAESSPADTPTQSPTPSSLPQAGATRVWEMDDSVMVYVPAGVFWRGSTSPEIRDAVAACVTAGGSLDLCRRSHDAEAPRHEIHLHAFWIDRTEVTNTQYRRCVEAGICEEPAICDWGLPTYSDGAKADHPVVCVDWNAARTYCQWAGKRLPTEAEWEKAARGMDGLVYPWGYTFDGRLLNFCDINCESERRNEDWDDGYAVTAPVGSYPDGESPYSAWDMAGNVWEWVSDWYDGNYYRVSPRSNPPGPGSGTEKVARGGSWYGIWSYARAATRRGHDPSDRGSIFGFRCAAVLPGD